VSQVTHSARTAWAIWFCVCLHIWWGLMLLIDPQAKGVTAISLMVRVLNSSTLAAIVFFLAGALAAVGILRARPGRMIGLLEVLPQQAVLLMSAFAACAAVYASQYADGVPRPRAFIAADQAPAVFIMLAHTASLFDCFIPRAPRLLHP